MAVMTKITAKYQITLPHDVRRALNANIGDLLAFVQQPDGYYRIQRVPPSLTDALRFAGSRLPAGDFREIHRDFEEGWDDKAR
jgi:AbrB family looped-hinge helix DNA binding protein